MCLKELSCSWDKFDGCKDSSCVCINPFLGKSSEEQVTGDPDYMCRNRKMCYVDCNSLCRDVENAKGAGRCFSRRACEDRDKSSSTECGLSRQCNHYECQDENVCNKARSCKWDTWKGCTDKSSSTECGLSRQCNPYECQDENVCNKARSCKW